MSKEQERPFNAFLVAEIEASPYLSRDLKDKVRGLMKDFTVQSVLRDTHGHIHSVIIQQPEGSICVGNKLKFFSYKKAKLSGHMCYDVTRTKTRSRKKRKR